jgi:hypothetical protein
VNFSCRCSRKYEGYDGMMQPVTRSVRVGLVEESGMSSEPAKTNHRTDQSSASGHRFSVKDAVRAFGVVLGPSLVLGPQPSAPWPWRLAGCYAHGGGLLACSDRS